jgi:hypothetical protein
MPGGRMREYRSSGEEYRIQKPEVSIQKSGICTGKLTPTLTLALALTLVLA